MTNATTAPHIGTLTTDEFETLRDTAVPEIVRKVRKAIEDLPEGNYSVARDDLGRVYATYNGKPIQEQHAAYSALAIRLRTEMLRIGTRRLGEYLKSNEKRL